MSMTKKEATEHARKLCRILGKGWKPRVHENLGWHFGAYHCCGTDDMGPDSLFFHPYIDAGGDILGWADLRIDGAQYYTRSRANQWPNFKGPNYMEPRRAVANVFTQVRRIRNGLSRVIDGGTYA